MPLTWTDPIALAEALESAAPDTDRLNLDREGLRRLVRALPGFADPDPGSDRQVDAVLNAWIALDGPDGDERWDPHV